MKSLKYFRFWLDHLHKLRVEGGRGDYFAEASYRALIQKASLTNKDTLQRQTQKLAI